MPWFKLTSTRVYEAYVEADTERDARESYMDVYTDSWKHVDGSISAEAIDGEPPR